MKKSYTLFIGLLAVTILNSALFGFLSVISMFGGGNMEDTGLILSFSLSTVISIFIILFSLSSKKKGINGILWLPMILSYFILLIDFSYIMSQYANATDSTILFLIYLILPILCLYLLIRKYYLYSKN